MNGSPWYKTVWIYDSNSDGRQFPMVYLANGAPGFVINQYLYDLMKRDASHNEMEVQTRALCHLYAFTCARYGTRPLTDAESANLVADFLDAKMYGTDHHCARRAKRYDWLRNLGLFWEPLLFSKRTQGTSLTTYANAITAFDKWQRVYHGTNRLSPTETRFMSAWERFQDFKQRSKWDMLLHLNRSRSGTVQQRQEAIQRRLDRSARGRKPIKNMKSFPPNRIVELIDSAANNVRDKLLLLTMLGGSLRRSEPLHLFYSDVEGVDSMGQAKIRLAHPEVGMTEWLDEDNISQSGTREEFFKRYWASVNRDVPETHPLRHLAPRTQLDRRNQGLHSGFKGMTLSAGEQSMVANGLDGRDYDVHYVWWCDPRLGAYWYDLFLEYEAKYLKRNPFTDEPLTLRHPWLFIIIEPGDRYGMPLSMTAVKAIWRRLKKKLGINYKLGWHSLRHYFGYYCANVLGLRLEEVQVLMHHGQPTSTEVYFHLSHSNVRDSITEANLRASGREDLLPNLFLKGSRVPDLPEHWTNDFYNLWMTQIEKLNTPTNTLPAVVRQSLEDVPHER
ncbi:tyrosine-type recombinase/integrase [Photobacterium sp. BZF1]|uniref:tyrosine-type recombinase/integrase n=1 Tax=Photobacterium sp. BZF1 TaxID=1904457 RepID=UPI001653925B|nr:tyrosine-type recombinase/integrase [Photobacterium sp. BZF1]MBC7000999.1 tyrosine-type recombinase/integrase [Photobacterium sp. BZF1]